MQYRTRKIVMPAHLNGAGTLFGGQALAWIDEEAAIYAACQLNSHQIVTKFMSAIDFKAPARQGDLVELGTTLVDVGRTSITVSCTLRNKTTHEEIVKVDKIVFVLLDDHGKPKPHGLTMNTLNTLQQRQEH